MPKQVLINFVWHTDETSCNKVHTRKVYFLHIGPAPPEENVMSAICEQHYDEYTIYNII